MEPIEQPQPDPSDPIPDLLTVFVSHSSADDVTVARLRRVLQAEGHVVLEDATSLDVRKTLPAQIKKLIEQSNRVIVLVSRESAESAWVTREIQYALQDVDLGVENIVPVMLPGADTPELRQVFGLEESPDRETLLEFYPEEPLAIKVTEGTPEVPNLGAILPGLKERLLGKSFDDGAEEKRDKQELAELVLEIIDPFVDDDHKSHAHCRLHFREPGAEEPSTSSEPFVFTPPLGVIEASEIRFYLERYYLTPFGQFTKRKERIEAALSDWGEKLYAALDPDHHDAVFAEWESHAQSARRFTVQTQKAPRKKDDPNPQNHPVVAEILGLPWELLHDGFTFFFKDGKGARVRRCLPGARELAKPKEEHVRPPLRVLIVCSRPEQEGTGYIDHRVSVRPLVEALESLGDLATWDILAPVTLSNLRATLDRALDADRPYHIVHFDGHGIYNRHLGLGQLVFEAEDDDALHGRKHHLVDAADLGEEISKKGVRLFFLEACQSAQSGEETDSSVAGRLIGAGIPSVAAMSHSVLVETARRFTSIFYPALIRGRRVGSAMLEGQRILAANRMRDPRIPLELADWFVPILFQHREDEPVLEVSPPSEKIQAELAKHRALYFGKVPPPPSHHFIGRSRQLLMAERLLIERDIPWILFRGEGGEGKTTIASELARWLVQSRPGQFPRAAFASVEFVNDLRAILSEWGEQLLPNQFIAKADSLEKAEKLLVEVLNDQPAVLILDNLESILPAPGGDGDEILETISEDQLSLLPRINEILLSCPKTRLILTSRQLPPEESGFRVDEQTIGLGRLAKREATELVANVLAEEAKKRGQAVEAHHFEIENEEEIETLVDQVQGHARAIVLLTPELFDRGIQATGQELAEIMQEMQKREGAGRETSLMASMELSLRRLDPEVRKKILPLGVFQGGANLAALSSCIGVDYSKDEEVPIVRGFVQTGLAELFPTKLPYLRFDPALAPALLHELRQSGPDAEREARARWIDAYRQLAGFLRQQRSEDIHLAVQLTRLELPNLLAALEAFAGEASSTAELVIDFATDLEPLLAPLQLPAALARVVRIRETAAKELENDPWSKGAFEAHRQAIERCWAASQNREALLLSQDLVAKTEAAGPYAYPDADYDMAMAQFTFGRSLKLAGQIGPALQAHEKAQAEFERIAEERENRSAAIMASACLVERANCLVHARQLERAAGLYEEAIQRFRKLDDSRQAAASLGQLATCQMLQNKYDEAIRLHHEARDLFETLNEPRMVATAWHQIGMVHQKTRQFEEAEKAYQEALRIEVHSEDKAGEADTRNQLGNLYREIPGRLEDSVVFLQRAAEIAVELGDLQKEGGRRSNLAQSLILLRRHAEAREALLRAIECLSPIGVNAEPWKTWNILANLERETGNAAAAAEAREKAIHAYTEARRGGWEETQGAGARLCETTFRVLTREPKGVPQLRTELEELAAKSDTPDYVKALIAQLLRLLDGIRDESLWRHSDVDYDDAAEILLLLEKLERGDVAPPAASEGPEIDPAQFRQLAEANDLDLAAMSAEEKVGFVASVLVQASGKDPQSLSPEEQQALIRAAASIAEDL